VLAEFETVAAERGAEGKRRWFSDEEMDLIVWYGDDGAISGFELCYDKSKAERAVSWKRGGKPHSFVVDDGEATPLKNRTPILEAGGKVPETLSRDFEARAAKLEPEIAALVRAALAGA
jgi:hypothetical protein